VFHDKSMWRTKISQSSWLIFFFRAQYGDMEEDTRNVVDKYRGLSVEEIRAELDTHRIPLEIAVENLERDFNMGTIVRTANAFNVSRVHVIGRKQWNRRGAMVTDAYMNIDYHATASDFAAAMQQAGRSIVAVDNVPGARNLAEVGLSKDAVLVFGSEANGISEELLGIAADVVQIEQDGSTRSVNVGVAAGIVMYHWVYQHVLTR